MLDADTKALPCRIQDAVPCRKKGSCTHTPTCQLILQNAIGNTSSQTDSVGSDLHLFLDAGRHDEQMRSGGLGPTKTILV